MDSKRKSSRVLFWVPALGFKKSRVKLRPTVERMDKAAKCGVFHASQDAAGCRRLMTAKGTERGEVRQGSRRSTFDDKNACSAQARHSAFDDSDCKPDGVQWLGI
ncbi:hypothetical protein WN943_016033 [Citrus x changshan-huyou]